MRQTYIVFSEELSRFFRSGATYASLTLFYLLTGGLFLASLFQASLEPQPESPLKLFWELQWLPNLVWVPLLTMRVLSQERRLGLLEATLATPTTSGGVILGKFLAVYAVYLIGWASAYLYMAGLNMLGLGALELNYLFDRAAVLGGGIFCAISGAFFVALGLWTSSLTRNGILAAALNVCLTLLYVILPTVLEDMIAKLGSPEFLRPFFHLENLSRFCAGEVEVGVLVGYGLQTALLLTAAVLAIERGADA